MSKITYIVATLAVVGVLAAFIGTATNQRVLVQTQPIEDLWQAWKVQFNKDYSATEELHRFATFADNYNFVQTWNADPTQTSTVGLNQFADLNTEEFGALEGCLNMKDLAIPAPEATQELNNDKELPANVDWRAAGAVTPVKNQQQCGSCWAFSTTGTLEGLQFITKGTLLSFSEQQIVDCSYSYGNEGCGGGWPIWALTYTASQGIELESTYPYTAVDGTCAYNASAVVFTNGGYQNVTTQSGPALAAAVVQQPISVCVEADQSVFQLYTGGVVTSTSCGTQLDHAILAVGYSNNNGTQPYWIVKNSWGATWGLNGYIYIAKGNTTGDPGICGINLFPSYATAVASI